MSTEDAGMHWRSLSSLPRDGAPFLGGVWDHTTDGTGYWETIELLQFSPPGTGRLFNLNSGNYTTILGQLTHWCALAPPPEEAQ